MPVVRALVLASLLATSPACLRAPAPLDVKALIAKRGPEEARRDLVIRVLDDPRDVQARLALAALADQLGRPTDAIEQLEAVQRLGGPLGVRWHADDRARLARLILVRGRARLARGAPTALADLERAASLGANVSADDLVSARVAVATTLVRHVDGTLRAKGRALFAQLAKPAAGPAAEATEESSWLGARDGATPAERGVFGAWLWTIGARREAYEQLTAWHRATRAPRDEALQSAYLRAFAWWTPLWLGELPPPPPEDLVGPERCRFPGADCAPPASELAPVPPLVETDVTEPGAVAIARFATTRVGADDGSAASVLVVARAYGRDPAIADRLASDVVARAVDAAAAYAMLGALFDALGDRARARAAWQEAATASPEAAFVRGLAEAAGRAGDGPGALVFATQAAAASGDPAVVWNAVGAALLASKQHVDALSAARTSIELAGPDELPRALELAIECSRALGRAAQADALTIQRAQVALALEAHGTKPADTDVLAALDAHRTRSTAVTEARLWVASRLHPRDVAVRAALLAALDADDARRAPLIRELLELAGDPDPARALVAVDALRTVR
jgi:tetratricopeptide (TPR) repeat protein